MIAALLALTGAIVAQAPAFSAPVPNVVLERTGVDVLAFSDDGKRALALETTTAGASTRQSFLILGLDPGESASGGVVERLPFSFRTRGILQDSVDGETCTRVGEHLQTMARDFRGMTVTIGLCSRTDRQIVDIMGRPKAQVLSKKIGRFHARVGFAGRTFLPPTGPLVVVIGPDALGNDRIGVTTRDAPREP